MRPSISIVVPFSNEEQNVAPLLAEIRAVCDGLGKPYEGIFVNDGSRDAAARRLDEVANSWPEAKTFHFLSNHGQAAAFFFGMKQAAGEILVTLDGDGQNDPADIPRLLTALEDRGMVCRSARTPPRRVAPTGYVETGQQCSLGTPWRRSARHGLRSESISQRGRRCLSPSDSLFFHGRNGSRRGIPPLPDRSGTSTEKAWPIEIRAFRVLVEATDRYDRCPLVFATSPFRAGRWE